MRFSRMQIPAIQALAAVLEVMNAGKPIGDPTRLPMVFSDFSFDDVGLGYYKQAEFYLDTHDSNNKALVLPSNNFVAQLQLRFLRTPNTWIVERLEIAERYFVLEWDGANITGITEVTPKVESVDELLRWRRENRF